MYQLEGAYSAWNQRSVIAECLKRFGFSAIARLMLDSMVSQDIVNESLSIVEKLARSSQDDEMIDQLCFAGLIYG